MSPLEDTVVHTDNCTLEVTFETERISICVPANSLKPSVSELEKLTSLRNPFIVNIGRVCIEGDSGIELSELTDKEGETVLCIDKEKFSFVTLQDWLNDRKYGNLFDCQIIHIVTRLIGALNFLIDAGVDLNRRLDLNDIHLVQEPTKSPQLSTSLCPEIKLSLVSAFHRHQSLIENSSPEDKPQTYFKFLEEVWNILITHNRSQIQPNPEFATLLKDIDSLEVTPLNCKTLQSKIKQVQDSYQVGVTYGLHQPSKHFIGRTSLETTLEEIITESHNKLMVIHGAPGIGKSELILQLSQRLLAKQNTAKNIIRLDASSTDNLTASLYNCVLHPNLNLSPLDYIGNPRLLKDIFSEMIVALSESDLLLVFDNADILSVELLDLLQAFKDNAQNVSTSAHHHLILISRELWSSCPFLKETDCTTLDLSCICKTDFVSALTEFDKTTDQEKLKTDEFVTAIAEILEGHPAALQIMARCIAENGSSSVLESLENFQVKYAQTQSSSGSMRPLCLSYTFSLTYLYDHLESNDERTCCENILNFLHRMNGEAGVAVTTLLEILKHLPIPCQQKILSMLSSLNRKRLLMLDDGIIRIQAWAQTCIQVFLQMLPSKHDIVHLLSACYIVLSSKSLETDCWQLISHTHKLWIAAAHENLELSKRFNTLPDLTAKLAKSFQKLELVTGFIKDSLEIFSRAFGNPHDIHIAKLKYLLAADSLLPRGSSAEAFLIFKSIQENCRTEPRDYLMIKLKCLLQLGKIHTSRQEFEKAISCYQNVQVFAVQKIGVLQIDSEPCVLHARLLHGQAHLEQGNLEESKKIILQVIPLLERYSGPELDFVKDLVLQSKHSLAVLLRQLGDLVNALMLQTKVTEERERVYGSKHPDSWASKREMCLLFSAYDNHDKALALLRDLLEIQEQVLGAPSNRHSLATMNSIAEIEAKLGNFEDALELYEAIDLIEQQVLGESDPMRISSQLSQAEVLVSLGQYKEACDIYDFVYTLRSTAEEKSSQTVVMLESIQRKKEAAERSMEVLGNYWLSLTPENVDDPSDLDALAKKHEVALQLAENLDNQGALRFLREVLEDCTQLEETNKFHLNVKADLARVLGLVGRFNESFSVYKEIIPLLDATFGETDELTMLCKDTMGQVFLFSGNQFLKRQMSNLKWFLL